MRIRAAKQTKEDGSKMMKFVSAVGMIAATLFVAGCATDKSATTANLAGTWQLTTPSGFQHKVHIIRTGDQRYRISKAGVIINGLYEQRGNRLFMVTPADSQLTDWVWKINNGNQLTLVKEPDVRITGVHYRASTLQRGIPVVAPPVIPSTGTQIEVNP
jgi:hypothetical protein